MYDNDFVPNYDNNCRYNIIISCDPAPKLKMMNKYKNYFVMIEHCNLDGTTWYSE